MIDKPFFMEKLITVTFFLYLFFILGKVVFQGRENNKDNFQILQLYNSHQAKQDYIFQRIDHAIKHNEPIQQYLDELEKARKEFDKALLK